jgi:hypothetical protein
MTIITAGHGPNIGHGWVKYVIIDKAGQELPPVVQPAVVARAEASIAGALSRAGRTRIGERQFWTGYDAQLSPSQLTMLGQDRLSDPYFIPALLSGALGRFPHLNGAGGGVCVSGLPATWALDAELAGQLGGRIRDAVGQDRFHKIKVIAEPLGLLYAALLDNGGQVVAGASALAERRVGVVDLGHLSIDLAELMRLTPVRSSLDTFRLGSSVPLGQIRAALSSRFDRDLSLLETDLAVRSSKVRIAGQDKSLPRGYDAPLIENGKAIAARLVDRWGSGAQFEAILVGGGGAEVPQLTAPICAAFPHAVVVPEPQTAVARGYARLARRVALALR